jgi:hypothetical protein
MLRFQMQSLYLLFWISPSAIHSHLQVDEACLGRHDGLRGRRQVGQSRRR